MQINRFQLSNLSIRTRIAIMILPLMLGVSISTGMNVVERYRLVQAMDRASELTRFAIDISALVQEMQKERAASAVFVASKGEKFGSELDAQRRATDQRRDGFEAGAGGLIPTAGNIDSQSSSSSWPGLTGPPLSTSC